MRGLLITLLMFSSAAFAADFASVTGTFSSLAYHADSGDLLGAEFKIVYSYEGHFITVQCSAGVPVTRPLKADNAEFSFVLQEEFDDDIALCGLGEFVGRITEDGLYYRKINTSQERFLPRQTSYWEERSRMLPENDDAKK